MSSITLIMIGIWTISISDVLISLLCTQRKGLNFYMLRIKKILGSLIFTFYNYIVSYLAYGPKLHDVDAEANLRSSWVTYFLQDLSKASSSLSSTHILSQKLRFCQHDKQTNLGNLIVFLLSLQSGPSFLDWCDAKQGSPPHIKPVFPSLWTMLLQVTDHVENMVSAFLLARK